MENTKDVSGELWILYHEVRKEHDIESRRLAFDLLVQIQENNSKKRDQEIRAIVREEMGKTLGGV